MKTQIHSYLTFDGNCREAMDFYKDCFGGEIVMQTIGESPLASKMPAKMKDYVLHSTLRNEKVVLMATDCVPESGLIKGNSVSLSLNCSSEEEIRRFYKKLVRGGTENYPLESTFWGALFGGLTDKFGVIWLLNFDKHLVNLK